MSDLIVVQVDDYDYYAGKSVEDCVNQAMCDTDNDAEYYEDAKALSNEDLNKLKCYDEDDPNPKTITMRAMLDREIEKDGSFPRIFMSTEY